MTSLLPRARLLDVLRGRSPLLGARVDPDGARGFVSPVEARVRLGIAYGDLAGIERDLLAHRTPMGDLGLVARAAVAALLDGGAHEPQPEPFILAARVHNVSISEAITRIVEHPGEAGARMVYFVHPHAMNLAHQDAELRANLARAHTVLPDGIGLRIAARLLGTRLQHNVNGTDLLPELCTRLAAEGIPLCLVGATPEVVAACRDALLARHPGLRIPVARDGYLNEEMSREFAARVATLGRAVVLVGMGSPLQERWASRHLAGLSGVTAVTVGGLFDFYSGRMPRAPMALRELGLEWAYRLLQEPRRMARRYLVGNPLFLWRVMLSQWPTTHARRLNPG